MRLAFAATLCCAVAVLSAAPGVDVRVSPATQDVASALLSIVLPELHASIAVAAAGAAAVEEAASPIVITLELAEGWRAVHLTPDAEAWSVATLDDGSVRVTATGLLGLAYAVHDLREYLVLAVGGAPGVSLQAAARAWGVRAPPTPRFEMRAWSEEGQLLALPDRGYYTADGAAADVGAIAAEAAALEAEIVPALLRLRMNSLIVLHSDMEDFVTYDSLPQFLPNAPAIYAPSDAHRVRRAGILGVLAPWIAHLADAFGIGFYVQLYELSSPPGVCHDAPSGAKAIFDCSLRSPATRALLQAKYSEVHAALPALAGIVVTVEDSWTPRAGYEFNVLWSGQEELPVAVSLFYDAIVPTGLAMLFRLWLFGAPVNWPVLRAGIPNATRLSVKITQGDFLLDYHINSLLQCGAGGSCPPKDRRIIVETDAFRQYNGWSSGVCYMGEQWVPRLTEAAANGAKDLWGWGSWAPGCTWPDSGPELINATAGEFKSWRSWWNTYRIFNSTTTNGGFSLGAQANAFLLYRLAWDAPPANATQIALDFGSLFFGAANAPAVVALLDASLPAWLATSSPSSVGDFTLFWTMMQHDSNSFTKIAGQHVTLAQLQSAADASTAAVARMEAALAQIDAASVPVPAVYTGAVRGVGVTKSYLACYHSWRTAGLAVVLLGSKPAPAACAAARSAVAAMVSAVASFDAAYPVESASWVVGALDVALWSAPSFLTNTYNRTMAGYEGSWSGQVDTKCGAHRDPAAAV